MNLYDQILKGNPRSLLNNTVGTNTGQGKGLSSKDQVIIDHQKKGRKIYTDIKRTIG